MDKEAKKRIKKIVAMLEGAVFLLHSSPKKKRQARLLHSVLRSLWLEIMMADAVVTIPNCSNLVTRIEYVAKYIAIPIAKDPNSYSELIPCLDACIKDDIKAYKLLCK